MAHLRQYLYSDRALSDRPADVSYLIDLRRALRLLGINVEEVSICHPGERFQLMGIRFVPTYDPRAALDRFLDDEIGVDYVSPAPTTHPQAFHGRDPGDEGDDRR